ncbi:MAG: hypothetical protein WA117_20930 [Verrucomicrobiia bacterium]
MITIASIPFLSTAPDWTSSRVKWKRQWSGNVASALAGAEQRSAMRSRGLVALGWRMTPKDAEERGQIEAAWLAGLKAGRIAIPYWSHGADLAADVADGASSLTIGDTLYTVRAGDFLWLRDGEDGGQLNRVDAVDGDELTLMLPTEFALEASDLIWPVVFGVPQPVENVPVESPARLLLDAQVVDIDESADITELLLAKPSLVEPVVGGTVTTHRQRIAFAPVDGAASYLVEVFDGAVCGGAAIYSGEVSA